VSSLLEAQSAQQASPSTSFDLACSQPQAVPGLPDVVIDQAIHGPGQEVLVQAQIPEKQKGAGALVTVGQRMVLDHQIQQIGGTARRAAI
jgi:hypothetical protein